MFSETTLHYELNFQEILFNNFDIYIYQFIRLDLQPSNLQYFCELNIQFSVLFFTTTIELNASISSADDIFLSEISKKYMKSSVCALKSHIVLNATTEINIDVQIHVSRHIQKKLFNVVNFELLNIQLPILLFPITITLQILFPADDNTFTSVDQIKK